MGLSTPILLVMWNRPEFVKNQLKVLGEIRPITLYVSCDGPRELVKTDVQRISECKELIESGIHWDCKVKKNYNIYNQGCGVGVSSAIDWVFQTEDSVIIIEDDVVCDESFFVFAESLLRKYREDSRVGIISANCFNYKPDGNSYFFTRHAHVWGWATWRDRWDRYDLKMEDFTLWSVSRLLGQLVNYFGIVGALFWLKTFIDVKVNRIDTWDYQLSYMCLKNGMVNICPSVELSRNIGFGVESTHTQHGSTPQGPIGRMQFPLKEPKSGEVNKRRDYSTLYTNYLPSYMKRLVRFGNGKR